MDVNNGNDGNPPMMVVGQYAIDTIKRWRESDEEHRWLFIGPSLNRLEAIFVAGNLRRDLPLEGSGNNPQTTELHLHGELSDEAIDVFHAFLQETPCHLVSLQLEQSQNFRRLLQALHPNMSIKKLAFGGLQENDGALVEELLRHKTDFTNLVFRLRRFRNSGTLTGLLSVLTHMTKLDFHSCRIGDDGLRVILQGKYYFVTELTLLGNEITSDGLGVMARRIPEAFPSLEKLNVSSNPDLLNSPENTQRFITNVLPMLKDLFIAGCGEGGGYIPMIRACEAETITKLELLHLSVNHPNTSHPCVRDQLIESLPKMKVKRLHCMEALFYHSDQTLMSALYKNTSIVEVYWYNNHETRRHVAPIMQRNKLLTNIKKYLLKGTIITPLGRWSRVLAEVGHERVGLRATPVYMILQAVLAQWVEPRQEPSQRQQQMFEQQQQQQDDNESSLIEPVAQPDSVFELQHQDDDESLHEMATDGPRLTAAAAAISTLEQQPCLGSKRRAAPTTEKTTKKIKSDSI